MAGPSTLEFTDDNFESEVLNADQPVLVDYWAEWCMPCKMLIPTIDKLAEEFEGQAKIGKIDTDAHRQSTLKYNINAVPTIILFKGGEVFKQFVGMTSEDDLRSAINDAIGA